MGENSVPNFVSNARPNTISELTKAISKIDHTTRQAGCSGVMLLYNADKLEVLQRSPSFDKFEGLPVEGIHFDDNNDCPWLFLCDHRSFGGCQTHNCFDFFILKLLAKGYISQITWNECRIGSSFVESSLATDLNCSGLRELDHGWTICDHGPEGCDKTATARYTLSKLQQKWADFIPYKGNF